MVSPLEPWAPGDVLVRREVLNDGRPWLGVPVRVVEDTAEALVTFIAPGARFGFPPGDYPIAGGRHPWSERTAWTGHGVLMVQRPDEPWAVWHFWDGPERRFAAWYLNIQEPFRRTAIGYDTQDLELDVVVAPDGTWTVKDRDLLPVRVIEGRFTTEQVDEVEAIGARLEAALADGSPLWDSRWTAWEPDPGWGDEVLPPGWEAAPTFR